MFLRECSDHRDQLFCLFELKKLPWQNGWSLGWKRFFRWGPQWSEQCYLLLCYFIILFYHMLIFNLHCQLVLRISGITKYTA